MKKTFLFVLALVTLVACNTSDKKASGDKLTAEQIEKAKSDSANFTTISWPDSTFKDMGRIKQGQEVEVSFRFKNTGTKNLIISNVSASCGCTVPERPEAAIPPGQEGVIKAKFDSRGRPLGMAEKEIYVEGNTKPDMSNVLKFRVEITE
jgi:hypothetical protein